MLGVLNETIGASHDVYQGLGKIEDVMKLYDVLQKKFRDRVALQDGSVEVEDESGNKMSLKVYEQLKKQGLI
ncbi:unnamed protein product [Ambrosiozyma monospora]|uniref:Unnamed protein product n=1 Tax=Ambrosiozyma monospora TaxID=43982 RepID=A0ACB5TSJ2_AMBMO|nr:unnamed protein product [Ambrosiozyma monospora]